MTNETPPAPRPPTLEGPPLYSAISQHWAHSEQIRWTALYNFLMASTILLLAWATIFVAGRNLPARTGVLVAFALAGLVLSIAWVGVVLRSGQFVDMYADLGRQTEGKPLPVQGPFTSAHSLRQKISGFARVARSSWVLVTVPVVFGLLYLFLTWVSLVSC